MIEFFLLMAMDALSEKPKKTSEKTPKKKPRRKARPPKKTKA